MRVLGLECSTAAGSVALVENGRLRGEIWLVGSNTHSERILTQVDLLLGELGLAPGDLDGISVSLGPGSFTGLRVALSTAKGLALGLGIPVAGVSTLEALAHQVPYWGGDICPMLDARRGFAYGALFRWTGGGQLDVIQQPGFREISSWLRSLGSCTMFLGSGASVYGSVIRDALGEARACFPPAELLEPRASTVARLGAERLSAGSVDELDSLVPLYVQRSAAERSADRAGGGQTKGTESPGRRASI